MLVNSQLERITYLAFIAIYLTVLVSRRHHRVDPVGLR